jgi:hypothetical protein
MFLESMLNITLKMEAKVNLKHFYSPTRLHGFIMQVPTVKASNKLRGL